MIATANARIKPVADTLMATLIEEGIVAAEVTTPPLTAQA